MKALLLVVISLAAVAMARPTVEELLNMDLKQRQLVILKLLNHVLDPVMDKDIEEIGKTFVLEEKLTLSTKTDIVKNMVNILKVGTLPRGEIFTINVERQMKEVISMFHLLYFAKDFAAFIETACYMRVRFNEGMFVYALTLACRHREDCKGIILPAPYEIYPFYFVRADVIQKAYLIKMKKGLLDAKLCDFYGIKKTDKDTYIIDENIFDKRVYLNDEDRLRYFTEDIDLNTYYYYFHIDYPFWMKDITMKKQLVNRRFEMTVYVYQQILARYYLERLCNNLGNIDELSFNKPIKKGYWPWLILHNGVQLPVRLDNQRVVEDKDIGTVNLIESYERIIFEAINKGYIEINGLRLDLTKPDDIETLGRLIYGKIDKPETKDDDKMIAYRYLLVIIKTVLGINNWQSDKYFIVPTALDSYQTALRDPVFYQLQKRIIDMVLLFKKRLPCYTKEELIFPGVKIESIFVDKLVTYFDDFLMDITNAVVLTEDELKKGKSDMKILARKRRLNNRDFKINLDVISDKSVESVVRIFIGPKRDSLDRVIDINTNRINFVELDTFIYKLVTGKNTIVRNSVDMRNIVRDRVMTRDLVNKIESIVDLPNVKNIKSFTGFPNRLLLPKGLIGGMEMLLYVIVSPLKLADNVDIALLNRKDIILDFRSTVLLDKRPLGFPLDRFIDIERFFSPNMKFIDVKIFHQQQTCDMKTRWNRYVLKNYNLVDTSNTGSTFNVDSNINIDKTFINLRELE